MRRCQKCDLTQELLLKWRNMEQTLHYVIFNIAPLWGTIAWLGLT